MWVRVWVYTEIPLLKLWSRSDEIIVKFEITLAYPTLDQRKIEIIVHSNGGARGVMVIGVGNGHGDTSSKPGRSWLHFIWHLYPWEWYESNYSPSSYGQIVGQTDSFSLGEATSLGEGKLWIQTW